MIVFTQSEGIWRYSHTEVLFYKKWLWGTICNYRDVGRTFGNNKIDKW